MQVLKECTAAGLTLFEIANVFSRPSEKVPSDFEVMCIDARADALSCVPSTLFATSEEHSDASVANPLAADSTASGTFVDSLSAMPHVACGGGLDVAVSPRSSLGMSGLLPGVEDCTASVNASSPRDISKVQNSTGGSAPASPPSPCFAAASGGSAPRQIVSSWLRATGIPPETPGGGDLLSPPSIFRLPLVGLSGLGGPEAQSDLLPAVFSTANGGPEVPPPPGSMLNMPCGGGMGAHTRRQRRRSAWASKRGLHGAGGALVRGVHPQKAKYVFTGISDAHWPVFVERMGEYVADELCKGTWRVGRQSCAMAGSCPEPVKQNRLAT